MVKETYINILENPEEILQSNVQELKKVIEKHPYFQSAHSLYLKGLKNQGSFKYNNKLKLTAAYTTDRSILFDFITSDIFKNSEIDDSKISSLKFSSKEEAITETEKCTDVKRNLEIGKPFSFNKNETHSFQQWLQLSVKKPIIREENPKEFNAKSNIIDQFIINNPKISKLNKNSSTQVKITESNEYPQLMTETLARVYLEQKKYENAIKAYKILSLKYPEKSGFFADQIKRIQILQNIK